MTDPRIQHEVYCAIAELGHNQMPRSQLAMEAYRQAKDGMPAGVPHKTICKHAAYMLMCGGIIKVPNYD